MRPPQVSRPGGRRVNNRLIVTSPSEYQPPAVHMTDHWLRLSPTLAGYRPVWENSLVLEPVATGSSSLDASAAKTVFLAPLKEPPSPTTLQHTPPSPTFQASDGVPISDNGKVATHAWPKVQRQVVLSADWACKGTTPRRSWTVQAVHAKHIHKDIYFGITEASAFHLGGRTVCFDVCGNFRLGFHPLDLRHLCEADEIREVAGASISGATFKGVPTAQLTVEVDLDQGFLRVQLATGAWIVHPIDNWKHARLCVSFHTPGDVLSLL